MVRFSDLETNCNLSRGIDSQNKTRFLFPAFFIISKMKHYSTKIFNKIRILIL